jgi:hypothetical protein
VSHHCYFVKLGKVAERPNEASEIVNDYKRLGHGKPIVIYFHGGLTFRDVAVYEGSVLSQSAFTSDICYPIYFVWNSDPITQLFNRRRRPDVLDLKEPSLDPQLTLTRSQANFVRKIKAVGTEMWDRMKADIVTSFHTPGFEDFTGGGMELVQKLKEVQPRPRIVLVAHSAGSIYALNFMEAARKLMPDAQFDVVFLAPACSYTYLFNQLDSWNALGYQPFRSFRMFVLDDAAERTDPVLTGADLSGLKKFFPWLYTTLNHVQRTAYPASLLYLVSTQLEPSPNTPLLGMSIYRHPAPANAYDSKWAYLADEQHHMLADRMILEDPGAVVESPTENDVPGRSSGATHHGDFFSDLELQRSLRYIVQSMDDDPALQSRFMQDSTPFRHLRFYPAAHGLHVDLDRLAVYTHGRKALTRAACAAFSGPTPAGIDSITARLNLHVEKSRRAKVLVTLSVNGHLQVRTFDSNSSAPIRITVPNTGAVDIRLSASGVCQSDEDWALTTLDSVDID